LTVKFAFVKLALPPGKRAADKKIPAIDDDVARAADRPACLDDQIPSGEQDLVRLRARHRVRACQMNDFACGVEQQRRDIRVAGHRVVDGCRERRGVEDAGDHPEKPIGWVVEIECSARRDGPLLCHNRHCSVSLFPGVALTFGRSAALARERELYAKRGGCA